MSLIHWWPLNGDTQDKITGQSGSLIGGGNVNGSGKIGKCYSSTNNSSTLASCADGISVANCSLVGEVGNQYSFACWFLVHGTHGQYQSCIMSSGDWNKQNCWVIGFNKQNTSISCPVNGYNRGLIPIGFTLTNNRWYHLATVYNNGTSYAYLDGELIGSIINPGIYQSSSTTACIGRDQAHGGFFPYNGDINDLRIYDHALSQAEVKELSKALVVHYTFDDILAEPTANIDPCKNSLTTQNFPSTSFGAITRTYGSFYGFDCVEMYLNTTYSANVWLYMNSDPITQGAKVGDTVTRSCWMYIPSGQTKPPYFTESIEGNSSGKTFVQYDFNKCDTWQRVSMTGTITDTGTNNYLHYFMAGSGTVNFRWYMRDFQMEIKDHATPYTSTTRESMLYNETGLTQPNYKANLKLARDAGSGTYNLKCTGSTAINTPVTGDISQGATAAFWIKTSTYPSSNAVVFADYNSRLAFGFYNASQAIISCGGQSSAVVSNLKTSWKNGWNHVVITRNNSTFKCYLNGTELAQSGSNNWSSNAGYSTIGCRYNGGYSQYSNCLIRDFRLYYNLLSEDEIKDLYKTKAYITDQGDVETHKFIEDCNSLQVTNNYCIETRDIQEIGNDEYEPLEYIASTGTQYIDTGIYWTSEKATIVADLMVTAWKASSTIFGSEERYSGSSRYFAHILHASSANGNYLNYIGTASRGTATSLTKNTRYVLEYIAHGDNTFSTKTINHATGAVTAYNNKVSYTGTILTHQNSTQTAANRGHIYIFSNHNSYNGTGGIQNMSAMRLYRFTMIQDDIYLRDFIPCRRKSDSKVGLFDLVTGQFYTSPVGNFTAGNVVTNEHITAKFLSGGSIQARQFIEI